MLRITAVFVFWWHRDVSVGTGGSAECDWPSVMYVHKLQARDLFYPASGL